MKVLNAFSLNMLATFPCSVLVSEINVGAAKAFLEARGVDSYVGHSSTASVFTEQLGIEIPCIRGTATIYVGEVALVGQYSGPRLDEGATVLPEGATIKWFLVSPRGLAVGF